MGQWFLTFGYKLLPASRAAPVSYVQVPMAAIAGFLIFSEDILFNFIWGSVIIFLSIYILMNKKLKIGYE